MLVRRAPSSRAPLRLGRSGRPCAVASKPSLGAKDDAHSGADDCGEPAEDPREVRNAGDEAGAVVTTCGLAVTEHREGAETDAEHDGCCNEPRIPPGGEVDRPGTERLEVRLVGRT